MEDIAWVFIAERFLYLYRISDIHMNKFEDFLWKEQENKMKKD